jgi:hypothetical protein
MSTVGLHVRQGLGYQDQDEDGKTREIDVVADGLPVVGYPLRLVIECKRAASPWVVFLPSDARNPDAAAYEDWAACTPRMQRQLGALRTSDALVPNLFAEPTTPGFSIREANPRRSPDQPDPAVSTLHQVVKAAFGSFQELTRGDYVPPAFSMPVIVLDGPLFQVAVDAEGEDDIQPVVRHRVIWHGSTVKGGPTGVDIITKAYLPTYAANTAGGLRQLSEALTPVFIAAGYRVQRA